MPLVNPFTRGEQITAIRVKTSLDEAVLVDGRYRVLGRLAQGGMGIVYRAEDVLLQRPAAIKVIDPQLAESTGSVERFRGEARALARVRHDNVVQIYAFGVAGPSYFFAMEFVDGKNLDDILFFHRINGRTLPLDVALEIITKIAGGLAAAHARSVTHRDVKPANIVIENETGRPVLVDFGIARQASDTQNEALAGTPAYMAPERIEHVPDHDGARADLYSLACSAFEILCGRPPFVSEQAFELMFAHRELAPPLVSSVIPDYAPLDAVFARALAKAPQYRPEGCLAFAEELREAAKTIARPPAGEALTRSRAVILAEDDGFRRMLVREAVRSYGDVRCVESAAELDAELARSRPVLIVLDDDAANGSSLELARSIRGREDGAEIGLVVLTRDMLAERSVWQEVDAQRLSKPLSARAFASTLEALAKASATGSSDEPRRT